MSITTLYTNTLGKGSLLPSNSATRTTAPVKTPDVLGLTEVAKEAASQPANRADLEAAVKKLNEFIAPALQSIEFAVDQDSEKLVVKVVDTATQKVLRQIPNEEALKIAKTLDRMQGLMIRQTA